EVGAQRHREARGMRRGDQLLGIGALAVLEARGERIVTGEDAVAHRERPRSALQVAAPLRAAVPRRHGCLLRRVGVDGGTGVTWWAKAPSRATHSTPATATRSATSGCRPPPAATSAAS